jgi:gliding motility-associated-like protein
MSIQIIPSSVQMLNPDTLIICSGESVDLDLQSNTLSLAPIWNCITTTSTLQTPSTSIQYSSTITDVLVNPESYTQEITYSVNFIGSNSTSACPGSANPVRVFVLPEPTINPIPDWFLCPNEIINQVPILSNTNNTNIEWFHTGDNIGLPYVIDTTLLSPSIIPGFTSQNNLQIDQTQTIHLLPSYSYSIPNTVISKTCKGPEIAFNITTKPIPEILDQTLTAVCSEIQLGVTFPTSNNGVSASSYNVTTIDLNSLSIYGGNVGTGNGLLSIDLMDDSFVNDSNLSDTVIYNVTPVISYTTPNGALSCEGINFIIKAPINPKPVIANTTISVCSDDSITVNLPDDQDGPYVATNGYSISNIVIPGNLSSSGGLPIICNDTTNSVLYDDQWNNTSSLAENIIYTIIPKAEATGCLGDPFTVTAIVNPEPLVNDLSLIVCSREELTSVDFITINGVTTTSYIVNALSPALGALDSLFAGGPILNNPPNPLSEFDFENDAFQNTGSQLYTITYHIAPYSNTGCIGEEFELTVDINPEPVGVDSSYTFCSDYNFGIDLQQQIDNSGNGVESSFVWTLIPPVNGPLTQTTIPANNSASNPAYNPPPHLVGTVENMGANPGYATFSILPTSISPFNCVGEPFELTLLINPEPAVNDIAITVCSENPLSYNLPDNGTTYSLNSINNINTTPNQSINIPQNNQPYSFLYNHEWVIDTLIVGQTSQIVTYNLTETSTNGCVSNPFDLNITVNPIPVVGFNISNLVNCTQTPLVFSNTSTSGINYEWDFDDGSFSFIQNPTHTYALSGNYNIELTATYPNTGCSNSIAQNTPVNYLPESVFNLSDTQGCDALDVTMNAIDFDNNWTYYWDFGNGQGSYQDFYTQNQFTTEGCYDISLTISTPEGCISSTTQNAAICMYNTPQAYFELDDYVINIFDNEIQTDNQTIDAVSYFWDFGDGYTTLDEEPLHNYADGPATYIIQLTAFNEIGCYDNISMSVLYKQELVMYVPNTFTPDEDQFNPTFKPVLTEGYKKDSYHLSIFNRWGEIVFESYDLEYGWDGSYGLKGADAQIGTYTWKIEVTEIQSGETRQFLGHVNLIR